MGTLARKWLLHKQLMIIIEKAEEIKMPIIVSPLLIVYVRCIL